MDNEFWRSICYAYFRRQGFAYGTKNFRISPFPPNARTSPPGVFSFF